jgi:hypothetical protein
MSQLIHQVPTHSSGHTLDLIITRSINDVTITSPLATFALSDHFFVECLLDIPRPNILVKEVCYRKVKHIDINAFKADICASDLFQKTWSSVNDMSKCYDITLRSVLDKHAPLKSKVMTVRPMVPWFNDSLKKLKAKFVDPKGIIRVGGRVNPSLVSYDNTRPALLPRKHWISVLVTRNAHQISHSGVDTTTARTRRKYWVIRGHDVAKQRKIAVLYVERSKPK